MTEPIKTAGLHGLRVLSLESRRAAEMAKLIENYGGRAIVAPSMREVPLLSNTEALAFGRALAAGEFDIVIFLTGGGTRTLARVVEKLYPVEEFARALRKTSIVARGPKPVAALKELNVPVTLAVPEPNTWRDLLDALDENQDSLPIKDRRVAVQEYGTENPELLRASPNAARMSRVCPCTSGRSRKTSVRCARRSKQSPALKSIWRYSRLPCKSCTCSKSRRK